MFSTAYFACSLPAATGPALPVSPTSASIAMAHALASRFTRASRVLREGDVAKS